MRRYTVPAVVLLILWAMSFSATNPLYTYLMQRFFSVQEIAQLSLEAQMVRLAQSVLAFAVNIGVAIWLGTESRKKGAETLVWVLLGLVFGPTAAILFLLLDIRSHLEKAP